ncbi:MAG: hypothetical protein NC410_07420 [Oscillibacter sp.]|nr:hypothetical protein [Oscillibacter sp.]
MIASVQYNDLRGTAAADISDFYRNSLENYLQRKYKEFDSNKYTCRGCSLWISDSSQLVNLAFICEDRENGEHILFNLKEMPMQEAFDLFKRLEIVLGTDIEKVEITQSIDLE